MWILDSEGDFLEGKRVWLRPGKKYLFGRYQRDGVRHAIDHKSISRKHIVIEVSPVKPGDGTQIHARSQITVSDQNSKCGTLVDGEPINGGSITLKNLEHTIKLGNNPHLLRIKWQPTVLTFSFSSKDLRAKDPLAQVRSRLEDLDIKTIIPYVVGKTTHVVQSKRNTAKGLQALVNGKYIVGNSFIDALVYAASPDDLENLESLSRLEDDFESAWPDPSEHLPPPGKEAVPRPAEAFAPDPDRIGVFEDYTFIFGDSAQYDNLQEAINNGHGKALLYPVENGVTTADEIVQFMNNTAGGKSIGKQRESPGGVILVRFRSKGRYEDWAVELVDEVALKTRQQAIEQSEFLDAILANDASSLCRTLPSPSPEQSQNDSASASPPAATPAEDIQMADSQAVDSQPTKSRPARVRKFVSKMKTFDDGFDMDSIPAHPPDDSIVIDSLPDDEPLLEPSQPPSTLPQENQDQNQDQDQKEEDVLSSLLPGSTAMKRRRPKPNATQEENQEAEPHPRPKRQKLDILQAARQHRDAEEDAARQRHLKEETELQSSLQEIEALKGLAIVEEMDIPLRKPQTNPNSTTNNNNNNNTTTTTSRWDDRWNGRKNFKKFRRKGDPAAPRTRIQSVIVPLEEVTRKAFGIGEHYWVSQSRNENSQGNQRSESVRGREFVSRSQSIAAQSVTGVESDSTPSVPSSEPASVAASVAGTRSGTRSGFTRQKRTREERDSDSEDELRFRFRRRR
ncbi:hypothetical protein BDV25DRAFT_128730 [Aspergillus avenaceus]|uniref:FHA domain-containing protein n=1 Tax=Aspergillus avenaceus TaxID=36643 RepID=A0A5N6TYM0_ASPAV|nr:hypothetical protein BDV25DRAFT_128730 [Aspergillus avenaceus]